MSTTSEYRSRWRRAAMVLASAIIVAACGSTTGSATPVRPATMTAGTTSPAPSPSATSSTAGATPSADPTATPTAAAVFDPTGIGVTTTVVVGGLDSPTDVTPAWDGSGRLFIAERAGRVRIVADGTLVGSPYLDIRDRIASGGERGLLGLAFHPDYPADPRFFVNYTDLEGDTVVSEFRVDADEPDRADRVSERILLQIDQPFANHNGGALAFGADGMLYISTGDGGGGGDPEGNGRRLDTLLAKILRIDIDSDPGSAPYVVPADNPFVGQADARPEIWLTGLRNPWRMRFDRTTGDLWIGDVGQGAWEEIDVARTGVGGLDYGWNTMEGDHCYEPSTGCDTTGLTLPVTEFGHKFGCAIIGGVVVRDSDQPRLDGGYIYSDACSGNIWLLDPARDRGQGVIAASTDLSPSSINEGEDGMVYLVDVRSGQLVRIAAAD